MDQLKLLMDYTKFHLGIYISLFTVSVAYVATRQPSQELGVVKAAMLCFLIAGVGGATIGSNIPYFEHFEALQKARIGPWRLRLLPYESWSSIEHAAFWLGIMIALYGFVLAK